ncbi:MULTISPECIES: hypothetical protein [Proteus]|uniref:hypothetical protein n=1 Tax=Proteus TaxID=583 RepID=UPI0007A5C1C9|nr:hypothetical protein [Proteus mirabilis]MCL8549720.1 transcriptional regulator [Proteus mirabilis]MCL8564324.1 transcriptional regulator [Proteus mirabilis]MCL8570308.1 transcriptional regulator [Proteus mirabilis]MCL8578891.1 transcriptional regulator [Proteus mirabilis]MCL8624590.1 transcriptional regulator [Proteus mirabilis]
MVSRSPDFHTFTALESVHTIIIRPQKEEKMQTVQEPTGKKGQTLNRYGSASKLSSRQQIPI